MYKGGYLILDFKGKEPEQLTHNEVVEMFHKLKRECVEILPDNGVKIKSHKPILVANYPSDPGLQLDSLYPVFKCNVDGGIYFTIRWICNVGFDTSSNITQIDIATIIIGVDGWPSPDDNIYIDRIVASGSL